MAHTPSNNRSDEMNSESLESLWRQALLIRDFARDEVDATRRRRADAEQVRQQAEQDSIRAIEELCADIRAEAQTDLEEAQATLETARDLQEHAEAELDVARSIKEQAEADSTKVRSEAQEAAAAEIRAARKMLNDAEDTNRKILSDAEEQATTVIAEATAEAEASVAKLRSKATEEIQRIAVDIEAARVAAQEELETQRILTDTIRIKSSASKVSERKERRRRRLSRQRAWAILQGDAKWVRYGLSVVVRLGRWQQDSRTDLASRPFCVGGTAGCGDRPPRDTSCRDGPTLRVGLTPGEHYDRLARPAGACCRCLAGWAAHGTRRRAAGAGVCRV